MGFCFIMKYEKPALTYEQQADLLLSRGLIAEKPILIERLKSVNYYRLSGYLHTFRERDANGNALDRYRPGTDFSTVWQRYTFDRQLRLLIMDGIERIEVALKTKITYHFCIKHGAFGYLENKNLPRLTQTKFEEFLEHIRQEVHRSKEDFVEHFFSKYGDSHEDLPLWMVIEVMSFGSLFTLYNGIAENELKTIAKEFDIPLPVLTSWVHTLYSIRNLCAHHCRLWNRELGVKPKIPRVDKYPLWHSPIETPNNRIFIILTIIKYMLFYIAPQSKWYQRFLKLLQNYPDIPLEYMGFPINWHNHSIWMQYNRT